MKAAIYCRVSSDRQREKSTIQSQKDILPKLAQDNGFKIVKTYVDDGISGETIEERPGFMQLLADAEEKRFDAVFVIDYDRLSRASDLAQFAYIKAVFKNNGVIVITPFQRYDFSNEEDDFISDLMGILAKREKVKIKSRCRRGRLSKWKQGKHAHGLVLYGYRWNPQKLVFEIHDPEARVVRLIYDLALQDYGVRQISHELEARGIPKPSEARGLNHRNANCFWSNTTILRILHETTYYGDHFKNKVSRVGNKNTPKPESEWIRIQVPPIITKGEWERVGQMLLKKKRFGGNQKYQYLLAHLLKCGECGTGMASETMGYYVCYRRRKPLDFGPGARCTLPYQPQKDLEDAVWTAIVRLVADPEFLKAEIRKDFETQAKGADTGLSRATLEKKIQDKKLERERVLTLFRKGRIDSEAVDREFAKVDGEEEILKRNLSLIENRERLERNMTRNLDRIEDKLARMRTRLDHLTFEEKRRLIETLTYDGKPGISVNKDGEIEFKGLVKFENADRLAEKIEAISVA